MVTLPNLNKGVTKDPTPPATDTVLSPITIPNGTTLVTTKTTNETIDNVDQLIDYVSGDNSPNFIPQSAIENLVADLAGKEDLVNKGAANGYAPLVSSLVPIANLGTGTPDGTKFLRDDGVFITPAAATGITSINADTTAAQIIAAGTGLGIVDVGATHTLSIDATVATLTGAQILTNKTITAAANTLTIASTDLTDTVNIARDTNNLSFFAATTSAQLAGIISDETGTGVLVFGTSPTIVTPTIASFTNAGHNHQDAAGGGQLDSTLSLSDTADITYLNTANLYIAGVRQDFLGLLAGTAGLNVGGIAGNPTTQVNGDLWLNTTTNQIFGRINGVDVDLGAGGGTGITSINADTTAAQVLAGTTNRISLVDVGDTHTFDIDAAYVGQSSITTLGTITTGVWNGTAITGANINAASTDLTDTADIAYLNTANVFGSALTQTFTHAAAATGFRLLPVAGDVTTTPLDGSIWYNLTTNKFRVRENGATVDLIGAGGGSDTPWTEAHDFAGQLLTWDIGATHDITTQQVADLLVYTLVDDEVDVGIEISNSDGFIRFQNLNPSANQFSPGITMESSGSSGGDAADIIGQMSPADDTGANPALRIIARQNDETDLVNRSILDIMNNANIRWRFQANGDALSNVSTSKFEIFKLVDGFSDELNTSSNNLFIEIDNSNQIGWDNSSGDFANAIQFNTGNNFQVFQGGSSSDLLFQVTSTLFDMQGLSILNPAAIVDAALNEQIIFVSVASAVNEFTITNAISANGPILSATGTATNIDININPKGTGVVSLAGDVSVSGDLVMGDRFQGSVGADIVGAATITLGDGNYFDITGNTNIDFMTTTGWQAGSIVVLQFDANSGVNDNTASPPANTAAFELAGDFTASAGDTITVVFDGTFWREISRSVN